jgi:hypothetical protein
MPDAKIVFIDPKAALGALTPTPIQAKVVELGPSPPHDEEPIEVEPIEARPKLGMSWIPEWPPKHYTQILDEIWPLYDEPQKRTAARLDVLLDEVADQAQRVHLLAQDTWPKMPWYKVPELERKRWDAEFLAYLRRLNGYRGVLRSLEPNSTDTDPVYVGLVKRQQGAVPVPDCIMHLYFTEQLGILGEHAEDMGKGFVGNVVEGVAWAEDHADEVIDPVKDKVDEVADKVKRKVRDTTDGFWNSISRPLKIAGGVIVGSIVLVTSAVVYRVVTNRPPQEPQPREPTT